MTTALDMIPAIGARVLVRCESLHVLCEVKNVKNSWGKPRLLVTPVNGTGEQWVEMERVSIPAIDRATIDKEKREAMERYKAQKLRSRNSASRNKFARPTQHP